MSKKDFSHTCECCKVEFFTNRHQIGKYCSRICAKLKNIAGEKFGMFTVLSLAGRKSSYATWLARCECGTEKVVSGHDLRNGTTVSCGCYRASRMGKIGLSHGLSRSRTYTSWSAMRNRCERMADKEYQRYGGSGVTVCERWRSFENFLSDMGLRPDGMSIDRFPNNNGNYEPGNCRWATVQQQASNRRNARLITHEGETLSLTGWSLRTGLSKNCLLDRLKRGKVGTPAFVAPTPRGSTNNTCRIAR